MAVQQLPPGLTHSRWAINHVPSSMGLFAHCIPLSTPFPHLLPRVPGRSCASQLLIDPLLAYLAHRSPSAKPFDIQRWWQAL